MSTPSFNPICFYSVPFITMIWTLSKSFIPPYPSFSLSSSTIGFQSNETNLRFHHHPHLHDYNTYFSRLSTIFYTSSFTKSTIITIATIVVTIHIELFFILHDRGPIPSSFSLRYYDINHDFGVHPQSSTFFASIYN